MPARPLLSRAALRTARLLLGARQSLYYRSSGGEARPVFHDIDAVCPALRILDRNLDVIRSELEAILPQRHRIPRYHEVDPKQVEISDTGQDWRTFFLKVSHPDVSLSNAALCPRTTELVRSIPDVMLAFFSILEPGKSIPAHHGPTFSCLRYHLALRVPRENPPSIRVKDRHHTWAEGESILFDDSWEHEVRNESDGMRVVLIVDVLRPAPWYVRGVGELGLRLNSWAIEDAQWDTLDEALGMRQL